MLQVRVKESPSLPIVRWHSDKRRQSMRQLDMQHDKSNGDTFLVPAVDIIYQNSRGDVLQFKTEIKVLLTYLKSWFCMLSKSKKLRFLKTNGLQLNPFYNRPKTTFHLYKNTLSTTTKLDYRTESHIFRSKLINIKLQCKPHSLPQQGLEEEMILW